MDIYQTNQSEVYKGYILRIATTQTLNGSRICWIGFPAIDRAYGRTPEAAKAAAKRIIDSWTK